MNYGILSIKQKIKKIWGAMTFVFFVVACQPTELSRYEKIWSWPIDTTAPGIDKRLEIDLGQDGPDMKWWADANKTVEERIQWWKEAKFGMFVHWGVYSQFSGEWNGKPYKGYAEHIMRKAKVPNKVYFEKAVKTFDPIKFDADEWIGLAKEAGMKYFVITAKHHDGVAMYPSKAYDHSIKSSKFKRDPMMELKKACQKNDIKFGFYYSHAFDWEHPNAPGNDWDYENPGGDKHLFGGRNWYEKNPDMVPRFREYIDQKAIPQLLELVRNYDPDIIWFDTPHKLPSEENLRIIKAVREAQPDIVINSRCVALYDKGNHYGDYRSTADRPAEFAPVEGNWEGIPTTNESYGYHKYDDSHKPAGFFIKLLSKAAHRGGNLLMNIGPKGDGLIDTRDVEILKGIGSWMKVNGESIYNTEKCPLPVQPWGETTLKGRNLYLHVFDWPQDGKLTLGGLRSEVDEAMLMNSGANDELNFSRLNDSDLLIELPKSGIRPDVSVIKIILGEDINVDPVRLLSAQKTNRLHVFEADEIYEGIKYNDGKQNRDHINFWSEGDQQIAWNIRLIKDAKYKVKITANNEPGFEGAVIELKIGGKILTANVGQQDLNEWKIGAVTLPKGGHNVSMRPLQMQGKEHLRLQSVQLIPEE